MNVVALISGGKDSTMNMIQCIKNGHTIVAVANLYPPESIDELDSFMYQSVGSHAIEAFASCLEVPLFRRKITGKPVNSEFHYLPTEDDEVEDLYQLLSEIKVQLVSSSFFF
eukprot:TRINITY_DN3992_c0_g1_i1.p1 TRINITY_DN3992_c0_g1~~TRINITY_DN3992_c0_g1_i1.p1  ORF type:complete len:127 (-),score=17.88 TRINITY_DN3992_c0_g1_i1:469-804(-)